MSSTEARFSPFDLAPAPLDRRWPVWQSVALLTTASTVLWGALLGTALLLF